MNKKPISRIICLLLVCIIAFGSLTGCVTLGQRMPLATVTLSNGIVFTFRLYYDKAPNTVKNFIELANSGFYDGNYVTRIINYGVIQMGDPVGDGTGDAGYFIKGEFADNGYNKNDLSHTEGMIAMARYGSDADDSSYYNTASCQFFVTVADKSYQYDGKYCVFGKILSGYDELKALSKDAQVDENKRPLDEITITSITVETYGKDYSSPKTIKKES